MKTKQTVSGLFQRLVMWLKLSYFWITRGRRRCKSEIDCMVSQAAVNIFKDNMRLTKFKNHPNHWAFNSFKQMCYRRIEFIEWANKDLNT